MVSDPCLPHSGILWQLCAIPTIPFFLEAKLSLVGKEKSLWLPSHI